MSNSTQATVKCYFEQTAQTFQQEPALWTPGWWYLTTKLAVEELKKECSPTDMFHYENLKVLINKVTRLWSICYDKWEITSLETLLTRTSAGLAGTFKTSLHSTVISHELFFLWCVWLVSNPCRRLPGLTVGSLNSPSESPARKSSPVCWLCSPKSFPSSASTSSHRTASTVSRVKISHRNDRYIWQKISTVLTISL